MIRILVCGSKGQLGCSLKAISGKYPDFEFRFTDLEDLNILDSPAVSLFVKELKPAYIINCAAYTQVDKAESESEKAFQLNAEGVRNLINSANLSNSRLIHISTDYVFNGKNHLPYRESDVPHPDSVYGLSKLKGEIYLYNSPLALIIRTSWLYSRYGHNFLKTVLRLAEEHGEIKMIYDQIGTPTLSDDLASAILEIIRISESEPERFIPGIYHYSNEGVASWYDFAKEILNLAGLNTRVVPIETSEYPLPAPRPHYSVLDKKKIRNTFGIEIRHWKDALRDFFRETRQAQD
jgi:dTDP-4-dehydrorhamnose reductase